MSKVYFTSDLHFCHDRSFLYEPRGFKNVSEMNQAIVDNWNAVVTEEDEVYILGDLMLNDNDEGMRLLKSLKGKIHIILGNHDTNTRIKLYVYCCNVVEVVYAKVIKVNGYHFYLSHYPTIIENGEDDGRGLHSRMICLYGHTHQQTNFYNDNPYMYHVGVDSHNCRPVSVDEIIEDIRAKKSDS